MTISKSKSQVHSLKDVNKLTKYEKKYLVEILEDYLAKLRRVSGIYENLETIIEKLK